MKKMIIKKEQAIPLVEFLQIVNVRGKASRLRNRLMDKLANIAEEMEKDRVRLCEEHAEKDEQGEALTEDGRYVIKDSQALDKEIAELRKEEVAVEVGEYSSNFQPLFDYLDSNAFDMVLSGVEANRYDLLMTIWEKSQEGEE